MERLYLAPKPFENKAKRSAKQLPSVMFSRACTCYQLTMSSNAKFREMGPFSLKIDIKTSGTTFDLIKNASESFWKFGLLTLRPFGLWPLRPSWKFASANGCLIGGCTQNFIKIGQQMTDLHQFLCFSLGLLLSNFKGHLQENRE